jgi:hypothetical protein
VHFYVAWHNLTALKSLSRANDVLNRYSILSHLDSIAVLRYRPLTPRRSSQVFNFEVSISAPQLDLGSESQQIVTLARARLIWDFQPLGAKARAMPVDFSNALDVKPIR